jgi:hypothetical protein
LRDCLHSCWPFVACSCCCCCCLPMARPALPAMRQGSWASAHISYKEESVSTAPPPNLTTSSMSSSNDASGLLSPRTQQLEIGSRERDRLVEKRMQDAEQRAAAAEQRALTAERLLAVVCGSIEPPITSRWPSSECCLMRTDTDALLVIVLSLCCITNRPMPRLQRLSKLCALWNWRSRSWKREWLRCLLLPIQACRQEHNACDSTMPVLS